MKVQSTGTDGKRTWINFGACWEGEKGINVIVDPDKNIKQNKATGTGWKMVLVPVGEDGENDYDNAVEIKKFGIKVNDTKGNSAAPSHSAYTWE
jgi:hypothetical protein